VRYLWHYDGCIPEFAFLTQGIGRLIICICTHNFREGWSCGSAGDEGSAAVGAVDVACPRRNLVWRGVYSAFLDGVDSGFCLTGA